MGREILPRGPSTARAAGIPWEGAGAEATQLRASTDLTTVADNGADEIYAAHRSVLYAVEDAESAGFTVGEDLSVISPQTGGPPALEAARQAHAQPFTTEIRAKATALTAIDQEVAAKVTTAAAGLRGVTLGDGTNSRADRDTTQRKPRVETVDQHSWRQGPGDGGQPPPQPPPDPPARGLPPDGTRPPVPGKVTPGPASRPSEQGKGGQSMWDDTGGEWRYFPGRQVPQSALGLQSAQRAERPVGERPDRQPSASEAGSAT